MKKKLFLIIFVFIFVTSCHKTLINIKVITGPASEEDSNIEYIPVTVGIEPMANQPICDYFADNGLIIEGEYFYINDKGIMIKNAKAQNKQNISPQKWIIALRNKKNIKMFFLESKNFEVSEEAQDIIIIEDNTLLYDKEADIFISLINETDGGESIIKGFYYCIKEIR